MHRNKKDSIENKLLDIFDKKEHEVPTIIWDNLENELFPKRKKRLAIWLFLSTLSIVLIAVILSNWSQNNNQALAKKDSIVELAKIENKVDLKNKSMDYPTFSKPTITQPVDRKEIKTSSNLKTKNRSIPKPISRFNNSSINKGEKIIESTNLHTESNSKDLDLQTLEIEDSPIKEEYIEEIAKIEDPNRIVKNDVAIDSLKKKQDSLPVAKPKRIQTELYFFAAYTLFDIYQNESYLRGGALSPIISKSNGFIVGAGTNLLLTKKHKLQLGLAVDKKSVLLPLDIYVDAANYKKIVNNNVQVPLSTILNPNCNEYYFVQNSTLKINLITWSFQSIYGYNFYSRNKFSFTGLFGTNLKLIQNSSITTPDFVVKENKINKYLTTADLQIGFDLGYTINDRFGLHFQPYFQKSVYSIQKSDFNLKKELGLPLKLSYTLK